ncbi:auxin efflux carrier component 3-like isoform 1, partial [Corchorus olitorius]
ERAMYQYMAHSVQFLGTSQEQSTDGEHHLTNQAMDIDTSLAQNGASNDKAHEQNGEAKDADGLENGQDVVLPTEDQSNTDMDT